MGEDGEYSIRVLPLAPTFDAEGNILPMDRKGYEYPVHQFFLGIKVPGKKGKKPKKSVFRLFGPPTKKLVFQLTCLTSMFRPPRKCIAMMRI